MNRFNIHSERMQSPGALKTVCITYLLLLFVLVYVFAVMHSIEIKYIVFTQQEKYIT